MPAKRGWRQWRFHAHHRKMRETDRKVFVTSDAHMRKLSQAANVFIPLNHDFFLSVVQFAQFRHIILLYALKENVVPTLEFKGKQVVYAHHLSVPFRMLELDEKKSLVSKKDKTADGNMIIHGDNLDALKALMPRYAGRVNCVYIDPPYNTGNEKWCYNDNVNAPMMKKWLSDNCEVDNEDAEKHDKWCCMMWPRLHLLHELLAENGVIFVSIDDNEIHHLRPLMDEIFGEHNFVANFIWEGTAMHNVSFVASTHDYILCYAKNIEYLKATKNRWRVLKQGLDAIYSQVEALKKKHGNNYELMSQKLQEWFSSLEKKNPSWQHRHYNQIDQNGCFFPSDISPVGGNGGTYEIQHPLTGKPVRKPRRGWRFADRKQMEEAIAQDRVCFGIDEGTVPTIKAYLHETEMQTINSVFYQDRRGAAINLRGIMGKDVFPFPKDHRVLVRILEAVSDKNSIVLDSFAGSGTTAHAVLELNKEDGGNRKFILVECEDYANSVTAERVRRAIKGIPAVRNETSRNGLGGGFEFFTLGDKTGLDDLITDDKLPPYEALASYVAYTATGLSKPKINMGKDYFFGEIGGYRMYLIYKPDRKFLQSPQSALTRDFAVKIGKHKKTAFVFAPWKLMSQKDLTPMNIVFCQLPYGIHRLLGNAYDGDE